MFKNLCVCITLILKFVFKNKQINELVWPYAFRLQEIVFLGLLKHHGENFPLKRSRTRWLHRLNMLNIEEISNTNCTQALSENWSRTTLASSFYEACVSLTQKSDKDVTRKNKQTNKNQPTNIPHKQGAKELNKILANPIQWYIKRIMHHDQGGIPGTKTGPTFENQSM